MANRLRNSTFRLERMTQGSCNSSVTSKLLNGATMRHFHPITPAVVHREARQALHHSLDWKPFHESVSVEHLLDLLLLMAASTASLFATVRRFFSFSHQTASLAVKSNLPDRQN